jgi:hypothetical protein
MRGSMMGLLGMALVLATACGRTALTDSLTSGTSTTGGSPGSGTSATSGTTSGTTTSGTTTAGTGTTTAGTGTTTGTSGTTGTTGTSGTPGTICTSNAQCMSNVCGVDGTGRCCTVACPISDATCGATACNAGGACVIPAPGTACGTDSCSGDMLTKHVCSGEGDCVTNAAAPCPNNFVCQDATSCKATCTVTADCTASFFCNGGACLAQQATGACTENDDCTSGICGASGRGHCCNAPCSTTDPVCAARDCDATTGACNYPTAATVCVSESCTGNTQTDAVHCDGNGTCLLPAKITDCSPFACGATSCVTKCTDNTGCIAADFCDALNGACCSGLTAGGTLNADAIAGNDATTCCSLNGKGPCQTLTQAMSLIVAAQATNVTLNATVDGGGGDWTAVETYPIGLGLGVELVAPGVFFLDSNIVADVAIFDVDSGNASIVGSATNVVGVGMNSDDSLQTDAVSTIQVEADNTLYLANASVNGSYSVNGNFDSLAAIGLQSNASLVLGQDQSAGVTGTVQIGNALGQQSTDGWVGIVCNSDVANSLGCTVTDAILTGQSSVILQGQEGADILAYDFSSITLASSPVIGVPPAAAGFNMCPSKPDGQSLNGYAAVLVSGMSSVTIKNATVQCIAGTAFLQEASTNGTAGVPTLTIERTVIQNADVGIHASAGTTTVTKSTLNYNFIGVWQDTDFPYAVAIDLSGGGDTVICSSNVESSQKSTFPGIDVYNTNAANLKADNVAWDTAGPDYFQCDNAFASCACNNASCTTAAGGDDMDAVQGTTVLPDGGIGVLGSITTTGNTQSPNGCN